MRLKLFLSFTLIVLVSVSLVAVIARYGAVNEVRTFMFRGGMYGLERIGHQPGKLLPRTGSWDGVQSIFTAGHGRIWYGRDDEPALDSWQMLLASVVADTQDLEIGNKLNQLHNLLHLSLWRWMDKRWATCCRWRDVVYTAGE